MYFPNGENIKKVQLSRMHLVDEKIFTYLLLARWDS